MLNIAIDVQPSPKDRLVEAFTLLRDSALFMIIATLLVGIGIMSSFFIILGMTIAIPAPMHGPMPFIGLGITAIILVIAISIAGAVLTLYAIFGKLIPSSTKFKEYDPDFSASESLIKIGLVVGIILYIIGIVTLLIVIGIFILIIAYIFLLIGYIGLAILCFKINSKFNSTIFLVAGILFIISIFIPIIGFVAWILVYAEAGTLREKALSGALTV